MSRPQRAASQQPSRRFKERGANQTGANDASELFRRAQRKIERRHYRDRRVLMYYEKERKKIQRQMGQDPYLDTAG